MEDCIIVKFPKQNLSCEVAVVNNQTSNFVEIAIINESFKTSFKNRLRWLVCSAILGVCLVVTFSGSRFTPHLAFLFAIGLMKMSMQLLGIIERETLKVSKDFGIEKSTFYAGGRRHHNFIPFNRIHKIVINEVIDFNRVIYAMQVLTEGDLCSKKAIVLLFDGLFPPLACLEIVHDHVISGLTRDGSGDTRTRHKK